MPTQTQPQFQGTKFVDVKTGLELAKAKADQNQQNQQSKIGGGTRTGANVDYGTSSRFNAPEVTAKQEREQAAREDIRKGKAYSEKMTGKNKAFDIAGKSTGRSAIFIDSFQTPQGRTQAGVYTSEGQFIPTQNASYIPMGFNKAEKYDITSQGVLVYPFSTGGSLVSGTSSAASTTNPIIQLFTNYENKQSESLISTKLGIYDKSTGKYYNEQTGLPVGVVTKGETYGSYLEGKNPVTASISWGISSLFGKLSKDEISSAPLGQSLFGFETGERMKIATTAGLYANTITGPGLALTSGVAQFATPGGLAEIKQAQGFDKTLLIGGSVLGIGAGGVKIAGDLKSLRMSNELVALEKTPANALGVRIAGDNKGLDIVYAGKETKYGSYITQIKQPYFNAGENRFTLESGQAITLGIKKGNKIDVSIAETFGSGKSIDTTARVGKMKLVEPYLFTEPTRIGQDVTGYSSTLGKINVKSLYQGRVRYDDKFITGTLKPVDKTTSSLFIGGAKDEGSYINFFGAKADTLRAYNIESFGPPKLVASGSTNLIQGQLKVYQLPAAEKSNILFSQGMGLKTIKQTPPSYATQLAEQSFKSVIDTSGIQSLKPMQTYSTGAYAGLGLYERTDEGLAYKQMLKAPQSSMLGLDTRQKNIFTFAQSDVLGLKQNQQAKQMTSLKFGQAIGQGLNLDFAQPLRTNQGSITNQIQIQPLISRQIPRMSFPKPRYTPTDSFYKPTGSFPFTFPLPSLDMLGGSGKRMTGKQRKKRVPSLYAALAGITAPRASKSEITGITLRPIIIERKRRRRK